MNTEPQDEIFEALATASLWVLLPRLAIGIAASTASIFARFWVEFGEVNGFTAIIAALAAGFQILLLIGLRFGKRQDLHAKDLEPRKLDWLGAFWLVAVVFGSVFGWFTSDFARANPEHAVPFQIATVILTIVLPILTSIPNYRFVTAANAYITLPMLMIISTLPSLVGMESAIALFSR